MSTTTQSHAVQPTHVESRATRRDESVYAAVTQRKVHDKGYAVSDRQRGYQLENGLSHVIDVGELFREHHVSLTRYLTRHCGDADVAADVVQETYLRLIERPPAHDTHVRAWMFTVATNVMRDNARTRRRRERLLHLGAGRTPIADPERMPDRHVEADELRKAMDRLLATLPDRDRTMLLMREEGFSHQEIADAVQVKPSSVGTLLIRALEKIAPAVERMSKEWL